MPKKTFSRNEQAYFTAGFYTDKTKSTPITPISAAYPSFAIKSPKGDIVHSGTAVAYSTPGTYRIEWTIPSTAQLSTDLDNWVVEWTMVSNNNRQLFYKENFQIVDSRVETPTDKSIIQVVPDSKSFRLVNYFESDPEFIQLDLYPATNTATPIKTISKEELTGPINEEGHIGYYVDIENGLSQGDYLVMWSYRNTALSEMSREFKTLRSVRTTILRYCDQLRILIDRFQKRLSAPNAYSDSDLIEFLHKGCEATNQWYPANNPPITWDTVDGFGMGIYVIAWAAYWGLRSQHLVETDLAFQYNGQSTTLDYDRTGNLDSAIQGLMDFITNGLSKAKTALARSANVGGVGSVFVRPYSLYQTAQNMVIPYSGPLSGMGSSIFQLMVILGL